MNHIWFIDATTKVVHGPFMARDDAQLKIRLPPSLKDRVFLRAQKAGRSMNSEIIDLLEEALSRYPYDGINGLDPASERTPSKADLSHEVENLEARMDVIDSDISEFADKLSTMRVTTGDDAIVRQMIIKRMSDLDIERDKIWEKVKLIKSRIKKMKND
ncbi:Arc type transcriptional repressor [Komagataeibacter phage phiKX2]|nr:Arc type transcriptional repressor [Komagataeibacter phage phiKX2]